MKSIKVKGKDYVTVNERVKYFRESQTYIGWALVTNIIEVTQSRVIMRSEVINPDGKIISTGIACEEKTSSGVNGTSHLENCETSAMGRALGFLGIGIDASIASAEEVVNAIASQFDPKKPIKLSDAAPMITTEQREQLKKLSEGLDLDAEKRSSMNETYKNGTFEQAKKLINELKKLKS